MSRTNSGLLATWFYVERDGAEVELTLSGEYTEHYGEASVGIRDGSVEAWLCSVTDAGGRDVELTDAEQARAEERLYEAALEAVGAAAECYWDARIDAAEQDRDWSAP